MGSSAGLSVQCKHANCDLGAQECTTLFVSWGVIQSKMESQSSVTSSTNDFFRPGPLALGVWKGIKSI